MDAITIGDLVEIYSGKLQNGPDGTRIRVVLRPVGDSDSDMVRSISPEVKQAKMQAEKRPGMLFAVTDQESADSVEKIRGAFGSSTLGLIGRWDCRPKTGIQPPSSGGEQRRSR